MEDDGKKKEKEEERGERNERRGIYRNRQQEIWHLCCLQGRTHIPAPSKGPESKFFQQSRPPRPIPGSTSHTWAHTEGPGVAKVTEVTMIRAR